MNWTTTRRVIGWSIFAGAVVYWLFETFNDAIIQFGLTYGIAVAIGTVVVQIIVLTTIIYLMH